MSSIWNAFTGGNKPSQKTSQQSYTSFDEPPQPSFNSSLQDTGVESFLQSSSFADPSLLHPLAGLNKDALEYLTLEDSALSELPGGQSVLPSRGFTDDLCYGTGVTYLSGLAIGGAWGLQEGLRHSANQPPRLRLNAVLNAVTRRGPFLGNSAGVVAITYNGVNSYIGYVRGKNDAANTIAAGTISGMLFKSTRGIRPMLISGAVVGSVAGAWAVSFFFSLLLLPLVHHRGHDGATNQMARPSPGLGSSSLLTHLFADYKDDCVSCPRAKPEAGTRRDVIPVIFTQLTRKQRDKDWEDARHNSTRKGDLGRKKLTGNQQDELFRGLTVH